MDLLITALKNKRAFFIYLVSRLYLLLLLLPEEKIDKALEINRRDNDLRMTSLPKKTHISFNQICESVRNDEWLFVRFIISSTRVSSELVKTYKLDEFSQYMKNMTIRLLLLTYVLLALLIIIDFMTKGENGLLELLQDETGLGLVLFFLLLWFSISRIFEISYAFFRDAYTHLMSEQQREAEGMKKRSDLKYHERVHLAIFSYIELIAQFALFYYAVASAIYHYYNISAFSVVPTIVDALYFSGVTITTLGYGDISPTIFITKFVSIFEVLSGFTLLIVSFTIYVSRAINEIDT